MITSLFRKSTPLNYAILILLVVIFYVVFQMQQQQPVDSLLDWGYKLLNIIIVFASLFIVNFIVKKNGLSKDSSYTVLFYFVFLLFFPNVLGDLKILLSNFFVLLACRRLISLQSLKSSKEKIFDASLWIFIASLFHFWSIAFILLVFISILFHAARDYRNWLLPFIAFFGVAVTFILYALVFDSTRIDYMQQSMAIDVKIDYFTNIYQNVALSLYATIALFFTASLVLTLSNRPLMLHSSYKTIISFFCVAILIYVISPSKSNELLLFTCAPVAMMATSHIEMAQIHWQKEVALASVIVLGVVCFFLQL